VCPLVQLTLSAPPDGHAAMHRPAGMPTQDSEPWDCEGGAETSTVPGETKRLPPSRGSSSAPAESPRCCNHLIA
jgi:hypothetical protein